MDLLHNNPDGSPTLVLAHGAGAPMDSEFMEGITDRLAARGVRVVRFEFPYMAGRRVDGKKRGPNTPAILQDTWREVYTQVGPCFIGGKSMGGRVASMLADELGARGLVCLGYPFHPPSKPEKLRTEHLLDLQTPALFLQGTRDPFGKPDEVATYSLSDTIQLTWVETGDHSFTPTKRSGLTIEDNLNFAAAQISEFLASIEPSAT